MEQCEPYCFRCYYATLASNSLRYRPVMDQLKGHAHNCHVKALDGTDTAYRFTPTEGWDKYSRRMNEYLHVCRKCKVAPPELRRRVAEREDEEILRHALGSSPNLYCGGCGDFLSRWLPKWWVCTWCKGACNHGIHPWFS